MPKISRRTQRPILHFAELVRVIHDPSNANLDYWLNIHKAEQAYLAGRLAFDVTNGTYTTAGQGPAQ